VVVLLPEMLSSLAQYRLLFVWPTAVARAAARTRWSRGARYAFPRAISPGQTRSAQARRDRLLFHASTGAGLLATGLSVHFGGVRAVHDVSFEAKSGEITSIIGPNGAGKSTLLNLICGFYRPDQGHVRLGDRDITHMSVHAIARAGIARTYQATQLFTDMTVLDNILICPAARSPRSTIPAFAHPPHPPRRRTQAWRSRARGEYSRLCGTWRCPRPGGGALAHVDKRLVEIARALAMKPGVLALDEPAAGLDTGTRRGSAISCARLRAQGSP